jgi:hypothetical protein
MLRGCNRALVWIAGGFCAGKVMVAKESGFGEAMGQVIRSNHWRGSFRKGFGLGVAQ